MSTETESPVQYGGFWLRFLAHGIDSIVLTLASWVLERVILSVFGINREEQDPLLVQVFSMGAYLCWAFPYYVWGTYRWGTTLGKRVFRLWVVPISSQGPVSLGQSVGRTLGYVLSYLPIGCGFLMAAFQPQKRALHDLMAGTRVVHRRPVRGN